MTGERFTPDHTPTTAEAAAAGEDESWQNEQIADPDDLKRPVDDPEVEEDEE